MFNGKTIESTEVSYSCGLVKEIEFTFTDGTVLSIDAYNSNELNFLARDKESGRSSWIHPNNMSD